MLRKDVMALGVACTQLGIADVDELARLVRVGILAEYRVSIAMSRLTEAQIALRELVR